MSGPHNIQTASQPAKRDWGEHIDSWVTEHQSGTNIQYLGITKSHWKVYNKGECCANLKCKKKFSLTERYHHCRRCGQLFCNQCTQYKRKLNQLANPDPTGNLYKACRSCFEDGPQETGQIRVLTHVFNEYKKLGETQVSVYGRFDMSEECNRLKKGFQKSVTKSSLRKSLSGIKSLLATPEWQIPSRHTYYKLSPRCYGCRCEFGALKNKQHFCNVCGIVVCTACCCKDLIIYIPNELKKDDTEPRLSIIRVVGCPDREPNLCVYLLVCQSCHQLLERAQVSDYHQSLFEELTCNTWSAVINVQSRLQEIQNKIDTNLPKFKDIISSLEISSGAPSRANNDGTNNIQTLAKAQEDLLDHFAQFMSVVQGLKKLKLSTPGQNAIMKNLVQAKHSAYQESMYTFRHFKKKLEEVTSDEVLQLVQMIVEKNSLTSAYVAIKQLAYETLILCDKHKLGQDVPAALKETTTSMEPELQAAIQVMKEDWDSYQGTVQQLIQLQIKDHRMIVPSRRLTQSKGPSYVETFILWRLDALITQTKFQLSAKCPEKSFKLTRAALEDVHLFVMKSAEK